MGAKSKYGRRQKGQAAIEMALSLPFVIWLIYYTINAFYSIHTAHVAQKYAAMGLYTRLDNRAKFVVDDVADQLVPVDYMAVQYLDDQGGPPRRKIIKGPTQINSIIGICREPGCQ
jgi:hypothetical protein